MFEWFVDTASTTAPQVNFLMDLTNAITLIAFILTNSTLIYFIIKYRRRGPDDETSSYDNSHKIEATWTIIPSIVFVILYVLGLNAFLELRAIPPDAQEINVWGKQWSWEYQYSPELRKDATVKKPLKSYNVLYLEEGRPVKLIMKSRDVIHSFFIPAFRIKEDVVGHTYTYNTFTPLITETQKSLDDAARKEMAYLAPTQEEKLDYMADPCIGVEAGKCASYEIYCTEYCGTDHSYMLSRAVVLSPDLYKEKMGELEEAANNIGPEVGEELYASQGCRSCHSLDGSPLVGPSFKGLFGKERQFADGTTATADENYITESILNPEKKLVQGYGNLMPPQSLSEEQIQSLIQYIKTIK